jgi:hypothetical protein
MFNTELSSVTLAIHHLRIVCIPLSLDLLVGFVEDVLSLMHLNHVSVYCGAQVVRLVHFENVLLSRSYNRFLRI